MANEIRLRPNFVAGGLSADMASAATSMSSAGLADLPTVDTTNHAALTLWRTDLAGRVTQKEVVWVTAHTSNATTATIVRGREGTTAQNWLTGDRWSCSQISSDVPTICTAATRPTNPYNGMVIWETDTKRMYVYDGTGWTDPLSDSGWITPTLLNSWVNYDTTAYQATKYRKVGDTVTITGLVKLGSIGAGVFNLPVGYRPFRNLHFATVSNAVFGILEIKGVNGSPAGDVHANAGNNTWYSLECSFMIG